MIKNHLKQIISGCLVGLLATLTIAAQQTKRPFTIDDLVMLRRVADPQLSPDGRSIAFAITDTDRAANKRTTQIYLMSVDGGEAKQLTNDKASASSPRWSPDGRRLAFISARETGTSQIWTMDVASGETKRVTNISTGADGPVRGFK